MSYEIKELPKDDFPTQLFEIPKPPEKFFIAGKLPTKNTIYLSVVGSRRATSYGRDACEKLITGLAGYPIGIVSGLALGIDSIAHKAALQAGLPTIAFPGSGLSPRVLYPKSNARLAEEIVQKGGALLSEFENDFQATVWSFPKRNRLMAGISKAVLVVEADERSGTLITARLSLDYNRDVLAVPNSIFAPNSKGVHWLLKQGAILTRDSADILVALGFEPKNTDEKCAREIAALSPREKNLFNILREPISKDELIRCSGLGAQETNTILMSLEMRGIIKEEMGELRRVI